MQLRTHPLLELSFRWLVGWVFIVSSINKIGAPADFAKIIYGYYLFPAATINLIAIILPFVELFTGLALIVGYLPRAAALIVSGMLIAFIVAVSINLARGHQFDCGCFSLSQSDLPSSARQVLIRDIFLLMLSLHVVFFRYNRKWCLRQSGGLMTELRN